MTFTGDSGTLGALGDIGAADQVAAVRRRRFGPKQRRETGLAVVMLLPSLVVFGVFIFYPFARNFYLGLFKTPPFPGLPNRYVGLEQYRDVLTSTEFFDSVKTTIAFAFLTVPAGIALGLGLAALAHHELKGVRIYRTIFSSTVATSVAVASVIFGTLMNPVVGLLPWLGLQTRPPLLDNPTWALPAVAVTTIWQTLGLTFILISSGLQSVPDELLEAATVDGAGPVRRFWRITFPLLSPTLFFAVVIGTIYAFQSFGQIDILTRGGPLGNRTTTLTYLVYKTLVGDAPDPGKAAVLSVALFAITMVLTLTQMRLLERRVHYA